jgi:hypothetical protein
LGEEAVQTAIPPKTECSVDRRRYDLGEPVPCSVQTAFHCAEVAIGDFGNFLVRLALELAQHEYRAVVLRQLLHSPLNQFSEMALPEQVVRPLVLVFELERTVVGVPVLLDGLEQDKWTATPVPQFVLRKIGRNRVDPGGEFLALIESTHVPVYANEHLLYEIFCTLTVSDGAVNKIQQPLLVSTDQLVERTHAARKVFRHYSGIVPIVERRTRWGLGCFGRNRSRTFHDCSHLSTPREPGQHGPAGTLFTKTRKVRYAFLREMLTIDFAFI